MHSPAIAYPYPAHTHPHTPLSVWRSIPALTDKSELHRVMKTLWWYRVMKSWQQTCTPCDESAGGVMKVKSRGMCGGVMKTHSAHAPCDEMTVSFVVL